MLGINFLQTHGGIITFPTNQLYLTTSSPKPANQPINTNHTYNTYTPPIHAPIPYHPHPRITVLPNHPNHVINATSVTIPARKNTIMTIPCTLPCSRNYWFEPSEQNFADHPVHCTPVIINAANDNLTVHFINYGDRDVFVPNHTYVRVMEKVRESDRNNLSTNATPEPVSQQALSECLAHSDLLPSQRHSMYTLLHKTQVSSAPLLLISPVPHLYNITLTLVMLNPSSNEHTTLATIIVRKSKSRWRRCYTTVSSNLVLAFGLAPSCWLRKQITHYDSV